MPLARMLKGLLTALVVMLVCAVIPVVQALGPFLGGYYGIRSVDTAGRHPLAAAARFGGVVGAAAALILAAIAVILMLVLAMPSRFVILTWLAVGVFAFYVAMMSTLGGLYRLMKTQTQSSQTTATGAADADAEPCEGG